MEATELRIRNYVWEDYSGEMIVSMINDYDCAISLRKNTTLPFGLYGIKDINPIPLTEQWLKDFGAIIEKANLDNDINYGLRTTMSLNVGDFTLIYETQTPFKDPKFHQGHTKMILEGSGGYEYTGELDLTDIVKYVHQLQNLYFALTGKELSK